MGESIFRKEAVESGASDIHLQPMAHGGVIRYRIDGVLRNSGNMPLSVLTRVVSRIKIMAKLDIADRLRPQDGRAKVGVGTRTVDLRISTVPTRNAEKMVIRILDSEEAKSLEDVGIQEPELSQFKHLLTHREGVVVVTGPTGSGKTTSLYAALRAILRQDPDVVFVGEIRDLGLDRPTLAETLRGALAQRLVRRVCPDCAEPVNGKLTESEVGLAKEYGVEPVRRPKGCDKCGDSGYRGRLPLVELLPVTPRVKEAIFSAAPAAELERVLGDVKRGSEDRAEDGQDTAPVEGQASTPSTPATPAVADLEDEDEAGGPPAILLVDDDPANRIIAKALLEAEGHAVVEAKDGVEAMECLNAGGSFSLVVLDLEMPRMNGDEVLAQIRGSMSTVGLPVIVLTGTTDPEAELKLMEAGADDYLRKPFDPRRFMIRVKAALRRAGLASV